MAEQIGTADGLASLTDKKYVLLETYRRNGNPVETPVWFYEKEGTIYVRTGIHSGKVKRLRRNPKIRLAVCNARGTRQGPLLAGTSRFVEGDERKTALALLGKKYGLQWKIVGLLQRIRGPRDFTVLGIQVDNIEQSSKER